jgi:transporter family-2 protein
VLEHFHLAEEMPLASKENTMDFFWVLFAFLLGVAMPLQTGVNMSLTQGWTHHTVLTAMFSSLTTSVILATALLIIRPSLPPMKLMPLWQYTGGLLGATMLLGAIVVGPRLGAAALIALILAGQLSAAVAFDHFGILGFSAKAVTLPRMLGIVFIGIGAFLVRRF